MITVALQKTAQAMRGKKYVNYYYHAEVFGKN